MGLILSWYSYSALFLWRKSKKHTDFLLNKFVLSSSNSSVFLTLILPLLTLLPTTFLKKLNLPSHTTTLNLNLHKIYAWFIRVYFRSEFLCFPQKQLWSFQDKYQIQFVFLFNGFSVFLILCFFVYLFLITSLNIHFIIWPFFVKGQYFSFIGISVFFILTFLAMWGTPFSSAFFCTSDPSFNAFFDPFQFSFLICTDIKIFLSTFTSVPLTKCNDLVTD